MPRRRQGYALTHVLLALLTRRGYRLAELRRVFGDRVYAYVEHLRSVGVVVIRDGVVSLNTSFMDTVRLYEKDLEKMGKGLPTSNLEK